MRPSGSDSSTGQRQTLKRAPDKTGKLWLHSASSWSLPSPSTTSHLLSATDRGQLLSCVCSNPMRFYYPPFTVTFAHRFRRAHSFEKRQRRLTVWKETPGGPCSFHVGDVWWEPAEPPFLGNCYCHYLATAALFCFTLGFFCWFVSLCFVLLFLNDICFSA